MANITNKIRRLPRSYEVFLIDAALHVMYALEDDDVTFEEAVTEALSKAEWAVTEEGVDLILANSTRAPRPVTASDVPDAIQRTMDAAVALRADVIHELVVECEIDPELFS